MAAHDVLRHRGRFYFSPNYAASLLRTTGRKMDVWIIRGLIKTKELDGAIWIAEELVTKLRQDPAALRAIKAKAKEPPPPPKRPVIGGTHIRHKDQDPLPIADYRLPLHRGKRLKD